MSGPWEQYAVTSVSSSDGPWNAYKETEAAPTEQPSNVGKSLAGMAAAGADFLSSFPQFVASFGAETAALTGHNAAATYGLADPSAKSAGQFAKQVGEQVGEKFLAGPVAAGAAIVGWLSSPWTGESIEDVKSSAQRIGETTAKQGLFMSALKATSDEPAGFDKNVITSTMGKVGEWKQRFGAYAEGKTDGMVPAELAEFFFDAVTIKAAEIGINSPKAVKWVADKVKERRAEKAAGDPGKIFEGEDLSPPTEPEIQQTLKELDANINAEQRAYDLMQGKLDPETGARTPYTAAEVERIVKKNPLVGEKLEAAMRAREIFAAEVGAKDSQAKSGVNKVHEGEVLPAGEGPEPRPAEGPPPDETVMRARPEGRVKGPTDLTGRQGGAASKELIMGLAAAGITLAAYYKMSPERQAELAQGLGLAGAALAVKGKGGNWHPEAVKRLADPLKDSLVDWERQRAWVEDPSSGKQPFMEEVNADRMVRNYLQRYAGTEGDPLKDVRLPNGERWEDVTDKAIKEGNRPRPSYGKQNPDGTFDYSGSTHEPEWRFETNRFGEGYQYVEALKSYMSHVGDYLRQNVKPEDLARYDLVRAVKETAAKDEQVRQQALKSWTEPNPERIANTAAMPEVKSYPAELAPKREFKFNKPGSKQMVDSVELPAGEVSYSWREIALPKELTPEQAKTVVPNKQAWLDGFKYSDMRKMAEELPGHYEAEVAAGHVPYVALDAKGKPIVNNFTKETATGNTPQEAWLAGRLAEEGNALGHCVGGYTDEVLSGQSKILTLRDNLGRSYATVEVRPSKPMGALHWMQNIAPLEIQERFWATRPTNDLGGVLQKWTDSIKQSSEYQNYLEEHRVNAPGDIAQIKGPGNGAPPDYVLPYIQDLVKSGKWGDVQDLQNTGLLEVSGQQHKIFANRPYVIEQIEKAAKGGKYITRTEYSEAQGLTEAANYSANEWKKLPEAKRAEISARIKQKYPGWDGTNSWKDPDPRYYANKTSQAGPGGRQGGAIDPDLLKYMAAIFGGAALGALLTEDDRTSGAIEGAALGAFARFLRNDSFERAKAKVNAAEEILGQGLNNIAAQSRIIDNNARRMKEALPDPVHQETVTFALDEGRIGSLPPALQRVARALEGELSKIGQRAKSAGVVRDLLENYITHVIDFGAAKPESVAQFVQQYLDRPDGVASASSRFSRDRAYPTLRQLQAAAAEKGFKIKTTNAAEIYSIYANSMERAIQNKGMADHLKTLKDPAGKELVQQVKKKTIIQPGWDKYDSGPLRGYMVHPELKDAVRFVMSQEKTGPALRAAVGLSQAVKRFNVVGSLFHAKSLAEAYWSALGPATALKDLGLAAFDKAFDTKHSPITQALEQFRKGGLGTDVDLGMRNGLTMSLPEDVMKGLLAQAGSVADTMLEKFGKKPRVASAMEAVERQTLGRFDRFTWDYLQTGLKTSAFLQKLEEARRNHPDVPDATHAKEIASHVNNSFGGQNWFEFASSFHNQLVKRFTMDLFGKKGRMGLQMLMFAPDWTASTLRAFTATLGKGTGWKGLVKPLTSADYARQYQLRTAMTYLTLINVINYAASGHFLWDNEDKTRIEYPDGTSLQPMKHAAEPAHWIADPVGTFANKMGFLPKAAWIALSGDAYAGTHAPKLKDQSILGKSAAIAQQAAPFQVQAATSAPEGQGAKRAVLGTLGFSTYGQATTPDRAATRRENKRHERRNAEEKRKRREMELELGIRR